MAGRRANFQWESLPTIANFTWATTASGAVSFATLGIFENPVTVRRIIVDFYCMTTSISDNINCSGRVGIIIVAPQVVAVGATAVPRPNTDGERPWMWNRAYGLSQEADGTAGVLKATPLHLHDDVRGMRKAKQNDRIICVIENAAGFELRAAASIRLLLST